MQRVCTLFFRFSSFNQGDPQPVYSSSPTDDTIAPGTNAVKSLEAPEAVAPTPVPQSRSWLASLSRRNSSSTSLNEVAKQTPPLERPTTPEPARAAAPHPAERLDPNPAPPTITSPVSSDSSQVPSNAAQPEADIKSIPSKRPWFTSSSSTKRPSKLRPMHDEPESASEPAQATSPAPEPPQLPVTNVIPPTPPKPELTKVESKPPPQSDSVLIPTSRKWFSPVSPLPSRSPDAETRTTSSLVGIASPTTPSSIDDQVPKLPSAGLQSEPGPSVLVSNDTSQNLSALNPSTSRFSLSIPFLGRPKVPLDRAVASVKADVPRALETECSSSQLSGEEARTEGEERRVETTGKISFGPENRSQAGTVLRLRYHSTFRSGSRIHQRYDADAELLVGTCGLGTHRRTHHHRAHVSD